MSDDDISFLNRDRVAALLPTIGEQIELVRRTYRQLSAGEIEMPPKIGIHPRQNAFIHAMPAYLRDADVAVLKWVSGYPENPSRGLPYISGVIVANDPDTGLPIAILDAAEITAARTAAASGACVRAFAPTDWSTAAILGAGEQGRYHARVLRWLNPRCEIRAFDVLSDRAASLCDGVIVAETPQSAVAGAQVVVTAGPIVDDPTPIIDGSWLSEDVLLLPIDFDFYVGPDAVASCEGFFTDDVAQYDYYTTQGHFVGWPPPDGAVGDALGRASPGRRIVCANLGVAARDAAFASSVLGRGEGRDG
jgi:alanine dehydrogenase